MARAAVAEVDLDSVRLPIALVVSDGHEVDGKPPDDAFARESVCDLARFTRDCRRVFRIGGQPASDVRLTVGSSE